VPEAQSLDGACKWIAVVNDVGYASVWSSDEGIPAGWRRVSDPSTREGALDAAAEVASAHPAVDQKLHDDGLSTVDAAFARRARERPDSFALQNASSNITYASLQTRVSQARAALRAYGASHGDTVGVCVHRCPDMIATVLAILSIGAAYVPLDGRYPASRLAHMAADAGIRFVVVDEANAAAIADIPTNRFPVAAYDGFEGVVCESQSQLDDLAYIMYTSGSTGTPKGVEVTHRNLAHFVRAMYASLPAAAWDRVLVQTRLSFDISCLEMFVPLAVGTTCVLSAEGPVLHLGSLMRLIRSTDPTLIQATPATWQLLLEAGLVLNDGHTVLCGGDRLPEPLARRLFESGAAVYNVYGPTEATVWATASTVTSLPVVLGDSLGHACVYVLDGQGNRVDDGEGELFIGGPAVARGYHNQPRLTAASFVPDPWSTTPGARMYATGDIVRARSGELEFCRRRDNQVKVNGNRIELGDVESAAIGLSRVRDARATVRQVDDVESVLVLFVECEADDQVPARPIYTAFDIKEALEGRLPPPMVPGQIVCLTKFPLNDNGKVDMRALMGLVGV